MSNVIQTYHKIEISGRYASSCVYTIEYVTPPGIFFLGSTHEHQPAAAREWKFLLSFDDINECARASCEIRGVECDRDAAVIKSALRRKKSVRD